MWRTSTLRTLANEDLGTLAEYDPPTESSGSNLQVAVRTAVRLRGLQR